MVVVEEVMVADRPNDEDFMNCLRLVPPNKIVRVTPSLLTPLL